MMDNYALTETIQLHRLWLQDNFKGARLVMENQRLVNRSFSFADLRKAIFRGSNLSGSSMYHADIRGADFRGADLRGVNFEAAIVDETTLGLPPLVCPEEGGFTAFKKVYFLNKPYIAQLYVPADAKRSSATSRKCRCSKAKVIKFFTSDRKVAKLDSAHSQWDPKFYYHKGKYVEPEYPFDEDRWEECASGIHFFMTFAEAVDY